MKILLIYLLVVNIVAFIACGYDKNAAINGRWRISERTLMTLSAAGGAAGMMTGMAIFRHKTKHRKFMVGVPLLAAVWIVLIVFALKGI